MKKYVEIIRDCLSQQFISLDVKVMLKELIEKNNASPENYLKECEKLKTKLKEEFNKLNMNDLKSNLAYVTYLLMNPKDYEHLSKNNQIDDKINYFYIFMKNDLKDLPEIVDKKNTKNIHFISNISYQVDKVRIKNDTNNLHNPHYIKTLLNQRKLSLEEYLQITPNVKKEVGHFFAFKNILFEEHFMLMRELIDEFKENKFDDSFLIKNDKLLDVFLKKRDDLMDLQNSEIIKKNGLNEEDLKNLFWSHFKKILEFSTLMQDTHDDHMNLINDEQKYHIQQMNKYFHDVDFNSIIKDFIDNHIKDYQNHIQIKNMIHYLKEDNKTIIKKYIQDLSEILFNDLMLNTRFSYAELIEMFKINPVPFIAHYKKNILENKDIKNEMIKMDKEFIFNKIFSPELKRDKGYGLDVISKIFILDDFAHYFIEKCPGLCSLKEKLNENDEVFIKNMVKKEIDLIDTEPSLMLNNLFKKMKNHNLSFSVLGLFKNDYSEQEIKKIVSKFEIQLNKHDIKEFSFFQNKEYFEKYLSNDDKLELLKYKKILKNIESDKDYVLQGIGKFISTYEVLNIYKNDFDVNVKLVSQGRKFNPELKLSKEFCLQAMAANISFIHHVPKEFFYDREFMSDFTQKLGQFSINTNNYFPEDIAHVFNQLKNQSIQQKSFFELFKEYEMFLLADSAPVENKVIKKKL